jgi:outer membrane immunogenic protein
MKKISSILFFLSVIIYSTDAQCPLGRGNLQLNAGLGFSGWGFPLSVGADLGVFRDITAGIDASVRNYSEDLYGSKYASTIAGLTANGNYHFNTVLEIPKKWDFYAGISFGYYLWSLPGFYPGTNSSGIGFGVQIGGRYFINKRFGLNLEFGGGSSLSGGKIGITYIFKD